MSVLLIVLGRENAANELFERIEAIPAIATDERECAICTQRFPVSCAILIEPQLHQAHVHVEVQVQTRAAHESRQYQKQVRIVRVGAPLNQHCHSYGIHCHELPTVGWPVFEWHLKEQRFTQIELIAVYELL